MKARCMILLLACLLPALACASGVRASLDRNQVQLGDTVTLNLTVDGGDNVAMPDLGPLARDFDVLGTSSSSSLNIVNGKRSASFTIGIALRPKRVGKLVVPSLTVDGSRTEPLMLDVTPPSPSVAANLGKHVFLEASVEPNHGYVGQQLLYTVRLYYDEDLSGSLDQPQLDGVDVRKLGDDIDYDTERGGHMYHVIERRYALIPHRAGTLTVPPLQFQGMADDPMNPFDPGNFFGSANPFGSLNPFGQGNPFGGSGSGGGAVSAAAPAVTLHVAPQPSSWGADAWLPARQLSLSLDGLPADGQVRVGQPLNLHMTVEASGLAADALPEPSLPTLDGAAVYPDRSVDSTDDSGKWLDGKRERAFAIVPQRAGTLVIPATTLKWFNVQSGRTEQARIPASTLTVLPAIGAGSSGTPTAGASASLSSASTPAAAASSTTLHASTPMVWWRWIALGSLALCALLILFAAWLWRHQRVAVPPPAPAAPVGSEAPSGKSLRDAFLASTRSDDVAAQARHLLAWARVEWPALQNLGELSAALASDAQRAAIAWLQRRQYAGVAARDGIDLHAAFAKGFAWRTANDGDDDAPLPPLYPFDLGPR